jgi:hypothetical protein
MNLHDMPSPGQITRSQSLQLEAFRAINYTRVVAERQPDSDSGEQLRKFFLACAKFCPKALTPEQMEARAAAEAARIKAAAVALASSTNPAEGRGSNQ